MSAVAPTDEAHEAPTGEHRLPHRLGGEAAATAGLAAILFWLAYDNGSFTLVSRTSLAVVVWWAIGVGVVVRLWPRARPTAASFAVASLLGALVVWTWASTAWASNDQAAFDEIARTILYLGVFVLVVLATPWTRARIWTNALALALSAIAVLALLSRLLPHVFGSTQQYRFLPFGQARLSYPIGYWNGLAILVMLAVPFLLRLAIAGRAVVVRAGSVAMLPVVVAVAYLASSRGGFVTGIVAALAFVALARRRLHTLAALGIGGVAAVAAVAVLRARPELVNDPGSAQAISEGRSAAALLLAVTLGAAAAYAGADAALRRRVPAERWEAVALGGVAIVVAAAILSFHPVQRFREFKSLPVATASSNSDYVGAHLTSGSGNGRWQYWQVAFHEFRAHPLIGGGAGSFAEWWSQHRPIASVTLDAHSLYLETLGELGLAGGAIVFGVVGVGLFLAVRRPLAARDRGANAAALGATFAAYAAAAAYDWMWELTIVTVVGLVTLALLASPMFVRRPPLPLPRWVRVAVASLAVFFVALEAIPLVASDRLAASRAAVRRDDGSAALVAARAAWRIEPWSYEPYLQTALVREQLDELPAAREAIESAVARDPRNWQLWLVRARLEAKSGDVAAARASLARVRALNPFAPVPGPGQ